MEQGQRIGNVGLLDIRHAEAKSIEAIERIGNVGTVLYSRETARDTVIPAGYELIDRPIILDATMLGALSARKLYCTERIEIASDVNPELLDAEIDGLISQDLIIGPKTLSAVVARKTDLLTQRTLFFAGVLWVVHGEETLHPQRFDYVDGALSILVTGELVIDPDVEPSVLAERIHQIFNFGEIRCTSAQMGAVQARLAVDEGALVDSLAEESDEFTLGNVGHLAL